MKNFLEYTNLDEELSITGRRTLARKARRTKNKMALGRKRAKRKTAPMDKLLARAQRRARNNVASHLLRGRKKSDLAPAAKGNLERQVKRRASMVKMQARKNLPIVRKDDRKR